MASCKVVKPYQKAEINIGDQYRDRSSADTVSMAELSWKDVFPDSLLQVLIQRGIDGNLDLKTAYTRILTAQAYYRQSNASLFPYLNATANYINNFSSDQNGKTLNASLAQYQLGVSSSWEIDVWGKLLSNKKANYAYLLQSEAAMRTVQSELVSNIATYYYSLLALDQQLSITQQTVYNWDTTVATIRALKDAARVTGAAVVQSEAQRYAVIVTLPDLKQQIRETENALSILLGDAPASIPRGHLEKQNTLEVLETGIPASLLANRPDVQQAELGYRATFQLTNVARAYFYPSLTITGSAGLNSFTLDKLINPISLVASIGGGLLQPIFNNRANKTRLEVAKAQQEAAWLNFKSALLNASSEVSNALYLNENALTKINVRKQQLSALEKSVEYSTELLQNGFADYTEVINARQSLLQAELGEVNDRLQKLQSTVNLYKALGGGWK